MNVRDLSCAISFEKNLEGPIPNVGKIKNAFRLIKWGFGFDSSIEQNVGGARQQGGLISRSPVFIIMTGEREDLVTGAALANTMLGTATIEAYHNAEDGAKLSHITVSMTETSIVSLTVIHQNAIEDLHAPTLVQQLCDPTVNFMEEVRKINDDAYKKGYKHHSRLEYTGRYFFILLRYNAVQVSVSKINAGGGVDGQYAAEYKPYVFS